MGVTRQQQGTQVALAVGEGLCGEVIFKLTPEI